MCRATARERVAVRGDACRSGRRQRGHWQEGAHCKTARTLAGGSALQGRGSMCSRQGGSGTGGVFELAGVALWTAPPPHVREAAAAQDANLEKQATILNPREGQRCLRHAPP